MHNLSHNKSGVGPGCLVSVGKRDVLIRLISGAGLLGSGTPSHTTCFSLTRRSESWWSELCIPKGEGVCVGWILEVSRGSVRLKSPLLTLQSPKRLLVLCTWEEELLTGAPRYGNGVSGEPSQRRKAYSGLIYGLRGRMECFIKICCRLSWNNQQSDLTFVALKVQCVKI